MSKEKHVRIGSLTYERLAETADEMELNVSELADRVLTDHLDNLEEEMEEDDEEEEEDEDY
jgi:hypothetical protein